MTPKVARDDEAAEALERGPAQDQAQTDPDEDQRPEPPPVRDLVGRQGAGLERPAGQRRRG